MSKAIKTVHNEIPDDYGLLRLGDTFSEDATNGFPEMFFVFDGGYCEFFQVDSESPLEVDLYTTDSSGINGNITITIGQLKQILKASKSI